MRFKNDFWFWSSWILVILMGLMLVYMYKKEFKWDKDDFALLGILGTVVAAMSAAYTTNIANKTLKEQREANGMSIKPYIIVKDKEFTLNILKKHNPLLINWETNEPRISDWSDNQSFLKIRNLSSGMAKNIDIEVEVKEYGSLLNKIQNRAPFAVLKVETISKSDEKYLKINTSFQTTRMFNESNLRFSLEPKKYHFVAIGDKSDDSLSIKIPPAFMFLMNTFLNMDPIEGEEIYTPYLQIKITCNDISGKEHKFSYTAELRVSTIRILNLFTDREEAHREIKFSINTISL
ncbi:hypothetical protein ACP2W0_18355 [Pseudobacillus badius]|uniref:hypothetical protein n=1 Tax=Bacillus badius TaxID=1455 RepID=UPI003CEB5AC7